MTSFRKPTRFSFLSEKLYFCRHIAINLTINFFVNITKIFEYFFLTSTYFLRKAVVISNQTNKLYKLKIKVIFCTESFFFGGDYPAQAPGRQKILPFLTLGQSFCITQATLDRNSLFNRRADSHGQTFV